MKPRIDATAFGSITVDGTVFEHDVIIRPNGRVKKRKKKLSKAVYGTSHMISIDEATDLYQQAPDVRRLIIGSGQHGNVELSPEAAAYVKERKWDVVLLPTPQAIKAWNGAGSRTLGLFHVTC